MPSSRIQTLPSFCNQSARACPALAVFPTKFPTTYSGTKREASGHPGVSRTRDYLITVRAHQAGCWSTSTQGMPRQVPNGFKMLVVYVRYVQPVPALATYACHFGPAHASGLYRRSGETVRAARPLYGTVADSSDTPEARNSMTRALGLVRALDGI